jgi:hypothetical protein
MLSDALQSLRTFDTYQAFRVSTATESGNRLGSELAWDPPTSAAWDEATHVTRGLRARADQLLQAVTNAQIDTAFWREQRDLADAVYDLLGIGDALVAYRNRIDALPTGDATGALGLLDRAWASWEVSSARFGLSRSEAITCG